MTTYGLAEYYKKGKNDKSSLPLNAISYKKTKIYLVLFFIFQKLIYDLFIYYLCTVIEIIAPLSPFEQDKVYSPGLVNRIPIGLPVSLRLLK